MKTYFFDTCYTETDVQAEHYGKAYHMHCRLYEDDRCGWQISAQTDDEACDSDWLEFAVTVSDDDAKKIISAVDGGCSEVDIQGVCDTYFKTHPNY